ncbi:MAG: disulfide bond formation protein B [Nitriliruptoraceae bacterium]
MSTSLPTDTTEPTSGTDEASTTAPEQGPGSWLALVWSEKGFNAVVATAALLLMALPVGLATIWLGFIKGESPCTLCAYERFGMVVISVLALFMLRYGPRRKYVASLIVASFFFLWTTVRHWSIHMQDDAGQGLAEAVFGVHTYTWGVFVFWVIIAAAGLGLLWIGRDENLMLQFGGRQEVVKPLSRYSFVAGLVVLALTLANSVQFLLLNGPPPFAGTGQPARMTFDIAQSSQYWSSGVYSRLEDPTLHNFMPSMIHLPGVHEDADAALTSGPEQGPIADLDGELELLGTTELGFEATGLFDYGNAAGIAYDADSGLFGIASSAGAVYYVEDDFSTVVSSAIFDRVNGYNVTYTTDATFFGPGSLVMTAWNKTVYGTDRVPASEVDGTVEWKEFRETSGDLTPVFGSKNRHRLYTARAKSAFTSSLAMDQQTGLYSVVNVPSEQVPDIVVSQFAEDHRLSREDVLSVADGVTLREDASLGAYYPIGSDIVDGTMYLLSRTYRTLLTVDMDTVEVTGAWAIPELGDYHGIAVTDEAVHVLSHDDGQDLVHRLSLPA